MVQAPEPRATRTTADPDVIEYPGRANPENPGITSQSIENPAAQRERASLTTRASALGNLICQTVREDPPLRQSREKIEQALRMPLTPMTGAIAALVIIQAIADTPAPYRHSRDDLLAYWKELLRPGSPTRFRPILPLAKAILTALPQTTVDQSIRRMRTAAEGLKDRTIPGRIIQKYIPLRKQAGVFHTRPEAATLMANLAVQMDRDWSNHRRTLEYRIADYSCGSGELLAAAYRRVRELCIEQGGTPREIHAEIH